MVRTITFWLLLAAVCWVVLGIINFVAWRVWLAHDIEHQLTMIRAAGLPTNGAEENNYYPSVPANENAALKMATAFALLASSQFSA